MLPSAVRRKMPPPRSRAKTSVFVVACMCILLLLLVQAIQFQYAGRESPLDHTKTTLLKPFYKTKCRSPWSTSAMVAQPVGDSHCRKQRPRMFMISARPPQERLASSESWKNAVDDIVTVIDTKPLSAELEPRLKRECPGHQWAYRLFLIYQYIFQKLLAEFPEDADFVFLEDDAILANATLFNLEICRAQHENHAFFSLYRAENQDACIYHSGTVAFYLTRQMMSKIIDVPAHTSCRLPIDLYIATNGPWFATEQDIVRHHNKRLESGKRAI